ncbi:dTDP-glucose 4,6-dehydratase [Streptomyces tsukubensis]|uniref:dTDP-glucose 4,6-dehydratase n=1 Tax=Streptomyces tsukubensis TaxID=83656 RepID=A0A1V4A3D1_9ACTN|nr:dTDP-glucose 4,6-dehydratase [Streptomyces tsukubensis]OON73877.1 dTDP-glucose 4,6-dehydratase [Streptomyces tsukubensis]QFR91752.1 dTDP-glucose 4,6-dehydratase [Streptomyces tsukubensis]
MRILVTGAAGFIGSHFVRHILSDSYPELAGAHVTALDKLTYAGNPENLAEIAYHPRYAFLHGDICDPHTVTEALRGIDLVVHFAAESHVDRSIADSAAFITTNVLGTHILLQSALDTGVSRFVHVSTDEVYGSIAEGARAEDHPLDPNSPYAASKASSDLLALAFHRTHGLDVRVTRCSNNYGPYQHPEKVIPLFVTNLLEGLRLPVYGDGLHRRDWLHVDDHCRAIAAVGSRGRAGEVYNIGGGTELSNVGLTHHILDIFDADWSVVEQIQDRAGHDRRYSVDTRKIREELGWAPRISFASGLAETVAWYRENGSWWKTLKA